MIWLAVGLTAFLLLPWHGIERGIFDSRWITGGWPFDGDGASGLFAGLTRPWLLPHLIFLLIPLATWGREKSDPVFARLLIAAGWTSAPGIRRAPRPIRAGSPATGDNRMH